MDVEHRDAEVLHLCEVVKVERRESIQGLHQECKELTASWRGDFIETQAEAYIDS